MILILSLVMGWAVAHNPATVAQSQFCKVTSKAADLPALDLGRAEALILTKADLHLTEGKSIGEWEGALNKFFEEHRHDPDVQKWVEEFVLEFTNRKEGDYIPGDWALQRKISDWRHFFLQQAHFEVKPAPNGKFELVALSENWGLPTTQRYQTLEALATGTQRTTIIGPDGKKREIVPELELYPAGLYTSVVENTMKVQYQLRRDVKGTATDEGKADLRRIYLQQTLLKEAYLRWRTEMSGI